MRLAAFERIARQASQQAAWWRSASSLRCSPSFFGRPAFFAASRHLVLLRYFAKSPSTLHSLSWALRVTKPTRVVDPSPASALSAEDAMSPKAETQAAVSDSSAGLPSMNARKAWTQD